MFPVMSLAELEKQVLELPEAERRQFAAWFYQNQWKLLPPSPDEDGECSDISAEVMGELLRRRQELDEGNAVTFTVEEMSARVQEALDEVHHSRH